MQAGVPPCSSHRSTQRKSEVERSGGTRKQVVLAGEEVQPVGQTAGAAGGRKRAAVAVSMRPPNICAVRGVCRVGCVSGWFVVCVGLNKRCYSHSTSVHAHTRPACTCTKHKLRGRLTFGAGRRAR
eukprot:scaffold127530_cov88-Phaeocystis_antarctica.AAC.1